MTSANIAVAQRPLLAPGRAIALAALALLIPAKPALAQSPDQQVEEITDQATMATEVSKRLIIPVPLSSPTLGTGGAIAAIKIYEPKGAGAPWISGAAALYTSTGNKAIGAFQKIALDDDRLRFVALVVYASLDQQFYGIGEAAGDRAIAIDIKQTGFIMRGQGLVEVAPDFYVGGKLQYANIDTTPRPTPDSPPDIIIPDDQLKSSIVGLGPFIQFDRRDNSFNATSGFLLQADWQLGVKWLGSDFAYDKLKMAANIYHRVGPGSVLAGRVSICGAGKDAPYYDMCSYGQSNDLRGYVTGQYRDRATWAMQMELRQKIKGRFGAVVFGGIGGLAPGLAHLDESNFLPAAGAGLRFEISKAFGLNARLDAAFGRHSSGIYFSLGEAF